MRLTLLLGLVPWAAANYVQPKIATHHPIPTLAEGTKATMQSCQKLETKTDCAAVKNTAYEDVLYCMHFSFNDQGNSATFTNVTYHVSSQVHTPVAVFLVGSKFYFTSQNEMWGYLQPQIESFLVSDYGYNPTNTGACDSKSSTSFDNCEGIQHAFNEKSSEYA